MDEKNAKPPVYTWPLIVLVVTFIAAWIANAKLNEKDKEAQHKL